MKKVITLIAMTLLLSSCYVTKIIEPQHTSYEANYQIELQSVECQQIKKEQFVDGKITTLQENGITKFGYADDFISIVWLPLNTQFSFSLINKSNYSIKIVWDEATYVSENGISQKVLHKGVRYVDRNSSQPMTTVVKGTEISDVIMPTNHIDYSSNGWKEIPLFKTKANTTTELREVVGKEVKILLPIKIEDMTNEYLFSFKIKDVYINEEFHPEKTEKQASGIGIALSLICGVALGLLIVNSIM